MQRTGEAIQRVLCSRRCFVSPFAVLAAVPVLRSVPVPRARRSL